MKKYVVISFFAALAIVFTYLLQPICIPLSSEELNSSTVPIEERTDMDFYLKVFQKKDGRWFQCKTRVSRWLFF